MRNAEIREKVAQQGIKYWQIAKKMDIDACTLSKKLRTEMKEEDKNKMMQAIVEIMNERSSKTMYKTNAIETDNKITVDINGLQAMLSIGKNTAAEIGEKAGAVIRIGRRKLYNVKKIQEYMDGLSQ